ncbi:MAG TPA: hypothetical protein DEB39_07795 [Planctomycetaceae bacterium]|nr:hypothetical protein [Planctomycetaceae bacterium]
MAGVLFWMAAQLVTFHSRRLSSRWGCAHKAGVFGAKAPQSPAHARLTVRKTDVGWGSPDRNPCRADVFPMRFRPDAFPTEDRTRIRRYHPFSIFEK